MIYTFAQIQQKLDLLNITPTPGESKIYQSYGKNGGVFTIELYYAKYSEKWDLRIIE